METGLVACAWVKTMVPRTVCAAALAAPKVAVSTFGPSSVAQAQRGVPVPALWMTIDRPTIESGPKSVSVSVTYCSLTDGFARSPRFVPSSPCVG